jgi:hypothetical protein
MGIENLREKVVVLTIVVMYGEMATPLVIVTNN